jgi:pimeloyl-ACP methyl ester carboxylesterase
VTALLLALVAAFQPFPESHFDTVDGVALHYRYWNVPPTELKGGVLLVHGFGASTFSWRRNIDTLVAGGYRVVAVDLPGYGYSSRERGLDHTQRTRAELLWQLLDEIDMTSGPPCRSISWVLVGHSMGGGTVSAMALQQPERTAGLVLVDAAIYLTPSSASRWLVHIRPIRALFEAYGRRTLLSRKSVAGLLRSAYQREPDTADVIGYLTPLQLPGTAEAIVDGLANGTDRVPLDMTGIARPTLIIWGDSDRWVALASGKRLESEIPDSELHVIRRGGHVPMETQPQEFNGLLLGFLSQVYAE